MPASNVTVPVFTLREAYSRALRVYDLNGLNVIPRDAAFTAMGYRSASGASKSGLPLCSPMD